MNRLIAKLRSRVGSSRALAGFACALSLLALQACTTASPPPPPQGNAPTYTETGTASWYGAAHAGNRTASGARFNPAKATAAHPSLPFNTVVRVINAENGRSVKVVINDRGPYVKGRIIDLSAKAAQLLGIKKHGVAPVTIEVMAEDQPGASGIAAR